MYPSRSKAPLKRKLDTIAVPADGVLRLAVVADTHSVPHSGALSLVKGLAPHAVLHAGDIGDLSVLDQLATVAPVYAVRGNIDVRAAELPDVLVLDLTSNGSTLLRVLLLHIGVNGPALRADAARLARAEKAPLVICGHSHVPFIGRDRGISVFNPGSMGPRRFALPIVFGVLELKNRDVRMRHIDCETGNVWEPPALPAPFG